MTPRSRRVDGIVEALLAERPDRPGRARADLARLRREHLRPYRPALLWAALLTLVVSALPAAFMHTKRFMVDEVLDGGGAIRPEAAARHVELCWLFFSMNMGLWGVRLVSNWVRTRLIVGAGQGMVYSLRKSLHEKLQALHVGYFEKTPVGVIMARVLDDVNVVHKWVTRHGPRALTSLLQIVIGLGTLMHFQWQLGLVVTASLPEATKRTASADGTNEAMRRATRSPAPVS